MKLIRNTVFETNSSSVHSLSLTFPEQDDRSDGYYLPPDEKNRFEEDIDMSPFKDKEYIYSEHSYDKSDHICSLDDKLSLVCDYLVTIGKFEEFIKYLKDTYNITILINSRFKLKGKNNYIDSYTFIEDEDNEDDYKELSFENFTFDQYTKFIFGEAYIRVFIGNDNY